MDSQVVIVGAGPAGALLSYLLSSRGIQTTLIERQTDFSREFRGEVLMPSGIRALAEAGFSLDDVATVVPNRFEGYLKGQRFVEIDTVDVDTLTPMAVSQPEVLESLVAAAEQTGAFQFRRGHTVRGLSQDADGVIDLRLATTGSNREQTIRAPYLIGADGRSSVVRKRLAPKVQTRRDPLDVIWFKVPYPEAWTDSRVRFEIGNGHLLIAIRSPDGLLQIAWIILKGSFGELRSRGIDQWVEEMCEHADPELGAHLKECRKHLSKPFLLNVVTDRVVGWAGRNTLLIGDAAHTMSPVGGQGLNLALRDAIVAANELVPAFQKGEDLDLAAARVEELRGPEVDRIQSMAAVPPKIAMGKTVFHDAARFAISRLAGSSLGRARGAPIMSIFFDGVTKVELTV